MGLILIGAGFFLFLLSNFPLTLIGGELTLPKVQALVEEVNSKRLKVWITCLVKFGIK